MDLDQPAARHLPRLLRRLTSTLAASSFGIRIVEGQVEVSATNAEGTQVVLPADPAATLSPEGRVRYTRPTAPRKDPTP